MAQTPITSAPASGSIGGKQPGWYIVTLQNGDYALVQWLNNAWQWTGIQNPKSPVTSAMYAGSSYQDIGSHASEWQHLLSQLPGAIRLGMTTQIDSGQIMQGKAAVFDSSGARTDGTPGLHSEAVYDPIKPPSVPNPLGGIDAIVALLTDPHTYIRLAELIGGIALVLMGLRSLTGSTTTPVTVAKSAAKAAAVA